MRNELEPNVAKKSKFGSLYFKYRKFILKLSPQRHLIFGFALYTFIGWMLLSIPYLHRQPTSMLDNLFTTTSAISTTGLVTVSLSDTYNAIGLTVIALLVQIGGIGYMTMGSFLVMSRKNKMSNHQVRILTTEFSLPEGLEIKDFIRSIIVFTLVAETLGAIALYFIFVDANVPPSFAIWSSIFHSISAFCTAGVGLYNDSLESFASNIPLNVVISVLSLLGSLGFIVVTDIWSRFSGKTKKISFTTKVIVLILSILLIAGTLMFYFKEPATRFNNENRFITSFFQSMSALTTAGFNTIPISNLSLPLLLFTIFLMYIGASPSGTAGGLKTTTLTAIIAIMWSRLRGDKRVTFMGKLIPIDRLYAATTAFIFYTAMIFFVTFLLSFTEKFSFSAILFEAASALGTVGLSTGITGDLSSWGKLLIIITMFIGRLGVITFGISILARKKQLTIYNETEDLAV
ncbi:TrkH family potassium uptake protein [Ornithobacterium rhinotracheale]|uniref:TrkH family potassium uptake protein n=1 Tax=Ornithobacterium rhinotracheale TaxID=28251 RepID=UPI00403591D3